MVADKDINGSNSSKMARNGGKIVLVTALGAAALVAGYQLYKNSTPKKSEHMTSSSTKKRTIDTPSTPSVPTPNTDEGKEKIDSRTKE